MLNRQKLNALKDDQDFELRCRREIDLEDEIAAELCERRKDEEIHYVSLSEGIQLIDHGFEGSNDDLSLIQFVK